MKRTDMSSAEKVQEFLQMHKGSWYCDACISESTGVEPTNQVNQITRTLALTKEYERADKQCERCAETRKCIRMVP